MTKECGTKTQKPTKGKSGFGIAEILISAAVLGFLLVSLNYLQLSNYYSLLQIRARDGAMAVSQEIIDSLSAIGVASIKGTDEHPDEINLKRARKWTGQPGLVPYTIRVEYDINVKISPDDSYTNSETSGYTTLSHVYAKRLDVTTTWHFKQKPFSIYVTGVVR